MTVAHRCLALGCLALAACASRGKVPPTLPLAGPEAVLQAVREQEDRVTAMRALFTAETDLDGRRRSAEGVLLVRKPDRFRLRLMLPFGLTLLDYLSNGDNVQITMPLRKPGAPPEDLAPFSRQDLGAAFLRGPQAFPGVCRAAGAGADACVVVCKDAATGIVLRRLRIDVRDGTIREEMSYEDSGEPRMILRFRDYKPAGSNFLPYLVTMIYPGRRLSVEIKIERYEVNVSLPDEMFRPLKS